MTESPPVTMRCMEVWGGNLPADSGVVMAGLDAWVYCKPFRSNDGAAAAGGDVYYVSSCATGRITRLLVADVSGHGELVSEVAGSLRFLMRKYVNYLDPLRFVSEMNRKFADLSVDGSFATAVVATFFSPTNHVTLCNAGHPPPLLYRKGEGWSYLQTRPDGDGLINLPLGIENESSYAPSDVKLRLGDLIVCYSDALPEAGGKSGQLLGQDGLLEVIKTIDMSDVAQVVPNLVAAITALHSGNLESDDVTILVFRPNGVGATTPLATRLLAPFRLAGALIGSMLPNGGPAPWPDHHPANVGGAMLSPLNRLWRKKSPSAP